jgi:hypothetical protein
MSLARVVFSSILLLSTVNCFAATKAPTASAAPKNAIESASGMSYLVLQPGKAGAKSIKPEFFEYRITAWNKNEAGKYIAKDGGLLRSNFKSIAQGSPVLARAVFMSPIGETRRWWFYNPEAPAIVQILDLTVIGNVDPAPAPSDVAAVPASASKTASGLAYRVIKKGTGTGHPTLQSVITIDYSGWTPDGKLFDSSITRGNKAVFPLNGLISGWKEGLTLMSPGDTYRFWIPGHLAYDSIPNANGPKGMLVFDVTLYSFEL